MKSMLTAPKRRPSLTFQMVTNLSPSTSNHCHSLVFYWIFLWISLTFRFCSNKQNIWFSFHCWVLSQRVKIQDLNKLQATSTEPAHRKHCVDTFTPAEAVSVLRHSIKCRSPTFCSTKVPIHNHCSCARRNTLKSYMWCEQNAREMTETCPEERKRKTVCSVNATTSNKMR